MKEVLAMVRPSGTCALLSLVLLFLSSRSASGQEYLYWPVPGYEDGVRGTFADYRNPSPYFHQGIDIHAPAGTSAEAVVDILIVEQVQFDQHKGYQFDVNDGETLEPYLYAHVQETNSLGQVIQQYDLIHHGQESFLIYDFDQDGNTDNDHVHLNVGLPPPDQGLRNPLWANDNPYRELTSVDAGAPEIIAVAIGPYDENALDNKMSSCGILYGDPIEVFDRSHNDILVYARGPQGQVGVRGLAYCTLDEDDPLSECDWKYFCDFTEGLPSGGLSVARLVYAFGSIHTSDCEYSTLTAAAPPSDSMWYIVTNTDGTANSFEDNDWQPPTLLGGEPELMQDLWIKAWAGDGPNEPNNVTLVRFKVKVLPESGTETCASLRVSRATDGFQVSWRRNGGARATAYEIWMECGDGVKRLVAEVNATDQGESSLERYRASIDAVDFGLDCSFRLDAILADGRLVSLAWANARWTIPT
jgi:hypothetical protein